MAKRRAAARLHLLTAKQVHAAADGDHSDGGGLLLRVRGGACSWVIRYTAPSGRRREMGLGVCHRGSAAQAAASLDSARDQARDGRDLLARGIDPLQAKELRRADAAAADQARKAEKKRQALTLARCAREYHARVIEPTKTAKHAAQWISSLENHVPAAIWHAPVDSVTAPALLAALSTVKPHERARRHERQAVPETLRRIRQRLDTIFEDAIFHGHCTTNPAAAIKRKMREAAPPEKAGQFAALPYRDAPAFMRRLRAAEGTAARCLEFAVLTAARTSEAISVEWPELDLEAGVWTAPAAKMKAREEHTVFLPARAVELLKAQQALQLHPLIVFPSPVSGREDKPLSNMAMLAVLDRMGMRDRTTVHGLCRSTFSTWANETAAARPDVIEACLAHNERDKVRAAYNRAKFNEERRALLAAWSDFLMQTAQVLPFKAA